MRPFPAFAKYMAENFKTGGVYDLAEVELRSMNAHKAFFAALNEAYANLREDGDADDFPSAEHLRKWALTYTEFCTVRVYKAATLKETARVYQFLRSGDEFSRLELKPKTKEVWQHIPNSQAVAAMPNNRTFKKSCDAVMIVLAQRLGVGVDELYQAGKSAA